MLCFGHRGAMGHAPENTLISISKALTLGADWVEVDVYWVDGHVVVFHDDRLERTTNGQGLILEQTFAHLRSLDAGEGEVIPTLDEVFDTVARRAGINIELKGPDTAKPVLDLIRRHTDQGWRYEQILVSSFDHRQIEQVRQIEPNVLTGALIVGLPADNAAFAAELGCYSVHPSLQFIDRAFVEDAHRRGLQVFVFTVNEPQDILRMDSLGVDGVFTNYPERVRRH